MSKEATQRENEASTSIEGNDQNRHSPASEASKERRKSLLPDERQKDTNSTRDTEVATTASKEENFPAKGIPAHDGNATPKADAVAKPNSGATRETVCTREDLPSEKVPKLASTSPRNKKEMSAQNLGAQKEEDLMMVTKNPTSATSGELA